MSTIQSETGLRVTAISRTDLDRVRARGVDDFGNSVVVTMNTTMGGTPLRCCLRDATIGERVALIAYRPSAVGGPYAEVGPVFVHADGCSGYSRTTEYPAAFRDRRQLFRAYGVGGAQVDNRLVDPHEVDTVLADLLGRPEIAYVHSRNPLAGCYMFSMSRASGPAAVSSPVTRPGGER